MKIKISLAILFFFTLLLPAFAQKNNLTISGNVTDSKNGEELIHAAVSIPSLKAGTVTNAYGFYSLTVPPGTYTVEFSYIGYKTVSREVVLAQNVHLNVEMTEGETSLDEVVVKSDKLNNSNVTENKTSVVKIDIKQVKKIPILLGEVDIIKAVQLLPGVQAAGDGSTNFIVRGGNIDHNLVQLDEAVVYNPSHVLGFFSVFNGDAIKDFEIYKGGIPAQYGGRLASVLDVHMKDGNTKNFGVTGGIGLLSSRLTVEGPIIKNKSSFLISGRRSYFDLAFPFVKELEGVKAYFGDLNLKANYTISDKDKIYLSGYMGRDALGFSILGFSWGNYTGTFRWNHIVNSKLFLNTSVVYSRYNYYFDINLADNLNFTRSNFIDDLNLKVDGNYFLNNKNTVKFGVKLNNYVFQPGKATKITEASIFENAELPKKHAIEQDVYVSHQHKYGARFIAEYGARLSVFSNIGAGRSINYVNNTPTYLNETGFLKESAKDAANPYTNYKSGELYNTYIGFEPRAGVTWLLNASSSLKASYNRMYQYMHLIQNITASTGQEFWTPSDKYIKPQLADQVSLGYFRNFRENMLEFSAEVYYKKMSNTVELRDGADIQFNEAIEAQVVAGQGRAYGIELFLRKQSGKTTGWLGYTLAKSERQAPNVNNSKWFPFRFDRRNYLTFVVSHEFTPRISVSGNFVYATGEAFSVASQRYRVFDSPDPSIYYAERNNARFPAYHRLDLSLTISRKKIPGKIYKNNSELVFALYNVYGRKNAYTISYEGGAVNTVTGLFEVPSVYKWYLFTFVPSVTYNFKF